MFSHAQPYRHLEAYEALTQGAQLPLELAAELSIVHVVYRFCFVLYCTYNCYILYYILYITHTYVYNVVGYFYSFFGGRPASQLPN